MQKNYYQKLIIIVWDFSFLSIAFVKDVLLIVIVASDIAKVIQARKEQCDVRKNYEQKKLLL